MTDQNTSNNPESAQEVEEALKLAFERPTHESIKSFYSKFIASTFFVPRRFQGKPISNIAAFPSAFTDLLAFTANDENYIPVFTSLQELSDWFSKEELEHHQLTGQEICRRAPDDWWISLNPAGDWGKEISPWEVERLRDGEAAIEELVEEQLRGEESAVSFRPIEEEAAAKLTKGLEELLNNQSELQAIYGGIHSSELDEDRYLFGIVHSSKEASEELKNEVEATLSRLLIGDFKIDTYFARSLEDSPALALFRFSQPLVKQ